MTDDYDSPWKDVLDAYFADFLALFLPHTHAGIDWSRGWESLDTELSQITPDADTGKRLADKLLKVWRSELAIAFEQELTEFEASMSITSIERHGIQRGIQQGEVSLLQRQLRRRFGGLPDWVVQRLQDAVPAQLEEWGERLLEPTVWKRCSTATETGRIGWISRRRRHPRRLHHRPVNFPAHRMGAP